MANEQATQSADEKMLMLQLKDILLREDRSALEALQRTLNEKQLLAEKINPIVEDHLTFLRHNFPKEYAQIVNRMVEQKLKSSQTEILDVIYPVMGKMINKYISLQFQELKDNINARINALFSKRGFVWWIRNKILGIDDADMLLASLDIPIIEEIFVIQRDTGLLLGSAALQPSVNRDVVAGMLTAIKSFVEDAFEREKEDLELIQYGTYKLLIENMPTHYFAVAMSGSVSVTEGGQLRNQIIDFIHNNDALRVKDIDSRVQEEISQALENHFIAPQRERLQKIKIKQN
ncbi:MAG: hypothetical protein JNL70_21090 [Saprospiraceae bacterium]|nr:hypothetical protein [Saprospiraceae bacterium]